MSKRRKGTVLAVLGAALLLLSGCRIVEPEKRAYPLVLGIDEKDGTYQVYFGMAALPQMTGQGKSGEEDSQGGNGKGYLMYTGKTLEEILAEYEKSQELYLDMGHIQAVIFGQNLYEQPGQLARILDSMEKTSTLGNAAYVYRSGSLEEVMAMNGGSIQSMGEYLAGIYENRIGSSQPLILRKVYSTLHNRQRIEEFPLVSPEGDSLTVVMESSGDPV